MNRGCPVAVVMFLRVNLLWILAAVGGALLLWLVLRRLRAGE